MKPVIFSLNPLAEDNSGVFIIKSKKESLNECITESVELSAPFTIICNVNLIDYSFILESIISVIVYNPDVILMDVDDFKYAVQLDRNVFWIDNFKTSKLFVICNSFYKSILNTEMIPWENAEMISKLTAKKFLCFPLYYPNSSASLKLEMYNSKNIFFKNI